jgi:hypothetical protein
MSTIFTNGLESYREPITSFWSGIYYKLVCALFGHQVSNPEFARARGLAKHCRCGEAFLKKSGEETRISHTVSCFLFGHNYTRVGIRDGHWEYVCNQCGHPLLFEPGQTLYVKKRSFRKKVRYLCNLLGHRVHRVTERNNLTEYACSCGHSFIKSEKQSDFIKHPLICLFAGHYINHIESRNGYAEFLCRNCGHTFCFVE